MYRMVVFKKTLTWSRTMVIQQICMCIKRDIIQTLNLIVLLMTKNPISQKTIQPNLPLFSKYSNSSSRAADVNRAAAGFIVSEMRPLGIVENLEIKVLLQKLDPRYVLPCRRHFADKIIPETYSEKKREIGEKLQKA